jgi:hypothetical protein
VFESEMLQEAYAQSISGVRREFPPQIADLTVKLHGITYPVHFDVEESACLEGHQKVSPLPDVSSQHVGSRWTWRGQGCAPVCVVLVDSYASRDLPHQPEHGHQALVFLQGVRQRASLLPVRATVGVPRRGIREPYQW